MTCTSATFYSFKLGAKERWNLEKGHTQSSVSTIRYDPLVVFNMVAGLVEGVVRTPAFLFHSSL